MPFKTSLIPASLLLALSLPATASVTFKCTTPSGGIQYTAVPPQGADCEELKLRNTTGKQNSQPAARDQAEASPKPAPAATSRTNNEDFERITRQNCQNAQNRLATLTSNARIRIKDGNTYRVISEEERQEKIKLAERQVEIYCK